MEIAVSDIWHELLFPLLQSSLPRKTVNAADGNDVCVSEHCRKDFISDFLSDPSLAPGSRSGSWMPATVILIVIRISAGG